MTQLYASHAGQFSIGGDIPINRLGFGAMRITGPGIWDEPEDRADAIRVLKRLPEIGVNFIDTADSYGPFVSENLVAEAFYRYGGLLIATNGGLVRPGVSGRRAAPENRPAFRRSNRRTAPALRRWPRA
jgi:pyridoxine 4-dehydrogenase